MNRIGFFIFLTLIILGCQDEDEVENKGTFTVTVDGTNKVVSSIGAKITIISSQNSSSGQGSHTLRMGGMIGEDSLGIGVSNWDFQAPPDDAILVKDYINDLLDEEIKVGESTETCMKVTSNQYVCEAVLFGYKQNGIQFGLWDFDEVTPVFTVSKCDGKKISGSFNVVLNNHKDMEGRSITISGTFTDLEYVVKK